jgi:hypothetical protein
MKANVKTEKSFDAVKFMRQERDRVSREIEDLNAAERLEYFKRKSEEFRKRLARTKK